MTQVLESYLRSDVHLQTTRLVHESRLAADESFVNFNLRATATDFGFGTVLHSQTDAMEHEPRTLLSNADGPRDLVGANAVPAIGEHPHCNEPLVQRDWRILKNGSNLATKLPLR